MRRALTGEAGKQPLPVRRGVNRTSKGRKDDANDELRGGLIVEPDALIRCGQERQGGLDGKWR